MIQPIDLSYFQTPYFLVTTVVSVILAAVAAWRMK